VITLRPYRSGDEALLFEAARESIAEVHPWMPWCHPDYVIEESKTWLESQIAAWDEKTSFQFGIFDRESERYLGGAGINRIDLEFRFANLGYWVRTSATGRGVATEATRQLAAWSFANTELERLEILAAVGNQASARVAEKAGARFEGVLRSRLYFAGAAHDARLYSLVRADV
jgi:RimJ/RimL family protein N-acetyltransferase